jgi:hypothetical protein
MDCQGVLLPFKSRTPRLMDRASKSHTIEEWQSGNLN